MPLPSSGPLSLNDIAVEFGGTTPHSLSEYYAGGGLVPSGTTGTNGAVPSSGTISIWNFYGTSNVFMGVYRIGATGTNNYNRQHYAYQDTDGAIYTTGYYYYPIIGYSYPIGIKLVNGASSWQRTIGAATGSNNSGTGYGVAKSGSNIVFAADINVNTEEPIIQAYNTSGTVQWGFKINGGQVTTEGGTIVSDTSNNIYQFNWYTYQYCRVIKSNSVGTTQFDRFYYFGSVYPKSIYVRDNVLAMSGRMELDPWQGVIMTANATTGAAVTTRITRPGDQEHIIGVVIDSAGAIYGRAPYDGSITKYSADLSTVVWTKYFSTGNIGGISFQQNYVTPLAIDGNNNVYAISIAYGNPYRALSYIYKVNSSGVLQWIRLLDNPNGVELSSISVTTSGAVTVAGTWYPDTSFGGTPRGLVVTMSATPPTSGTALGVTISTPAFTWSDSYENGSVYPISSSSPTNAMLADTATTTPSEPVAYATT